MKTIIVAVIALVIGFAAGAAGSSSNSTTNTAAPRVASGTTAGSGTAPAVATQAPATRESVTLNGSEHGKTRPISLSGNYTIEWTSKTGPRSGGNFMVDLKPVNGGHYEALINSIFDQSTSHSGTTQVYNTKGDYYFDVIGGGDWTFKVIPL